MDKEEKLSAAQSLALDIHKACVGHRLSDVYAAMEMFMSELKNLSVVTGEIEMEISEVPVMPTETATGWR